MLVQFPNSVQGIGDIPSKTADAFTKDNIDDILRRQIGDTFVQVLECAGVYKRTAEGQAAFDRFIGYVNSL